MKPSLQFPKVCHCSILHNVDDSRIFYKESISLSKYGFDVTLVAKKSKNLNFQSKSYHGVKLFALKNENRIINHLFLIKYIFKNKFQIIHFHDPDLIILGFLFKFIGKKVIYDVHENVRQDIMYKTWIIPPLRTIISKFIIVLEFLAGTYFDGIISATPSISNNFKNKNNFIICNFPSKNLNIDYKKYHPKKNIIIYIGTLSKSRGVKELISAAELFSDIAELWILGKWYDQGFKMECMNLNGFKNTKYIGNINHEEIHNYLKMASIGICTLHPIDTYKESYPIKVFEYMQNGLPVLLSNFEFWRKIFGTLCEYVDPTNPLLISDKIKYLLNYPERLTEMSLSGKKAIEDNFNWENEACKLLDLYKKI